VGRAGEAGFLFVGRLAVNKWNNDITEEEIYAWYVLLCLVSERKEYL